MSWFRDDARNLDHIAYFSIDRRSQGCSSSLELGSGFLDTFRFFDEDNVNLQSEIISIESKSVSRVEWLRRAYSFREPNWK